MHAPNRFRIALLLCGGALAAGAGGAMAARPAASAGECFASAFESGDADAIAACYAEDAILWFPGGSMAKGRAAIRDGFAHFLAGATVKDFQMTNIGQESVGDSRVSWGTYVIRMVDKASQAESVQTGRYTDVQKLVDGRWLYIVDHPSDDPAPPAK